MMVVVNNLPTVSILIPTLNAAKVLVGCLESIISQDYPKNKLEIIVADGGSTDDTRIIAEKYAAKVYENPLKTGEAGKAVAFRHARGELVALIDSDNILPDKNWLRGMVTPFYDPEIVGTEPWQFTYRKENGFIDRYCALLGMNDPLCFFLGNYDRVNTLTGKWTELEIVQEDKGDWVKVNLEGSNIPTIGANGTIFRRRFLEESKMVGDYLFDIDIIAQLASKKPVIFAKVKIGIVHLYCGSDILKFIRKQKRRVKDYLYYQKIGVRKYPWQKQNKVKLLTFVFACITLGLLIYQTVKGYLKVRDKAWFFHPLACWITLAVYAEGFCGILFSKQEMSRKGWGQ